MSLDESWEVGRFHSLISNYKSGRLRIDLQGRKECKYCLIKRQDSRFTMRSNPKGCWHGCHKVQQYLPAHATYMNASFISKAFCGFQPILAVLFLSFHSFSLTLTHGTAPSSGVWGSTPFMS